MPGLRGRLDESFHAGAFLFSLNWRSADACQFHSFRPRQEASKVTNSVFYAAPSQPLRLCPGGRQELIRLWTSVA